MCKSPLPPSSALPLFLSQIAAAGGTSPLPHINTQWNIPPMNYKSVPPDSQVCWVFQRATQTSKMPVNISGTWDIVSNVNFEGYMVALGKYFSSLIKEMTCHHTHWHFISGFSSVLNYGMLIRWAGMKYVKMKAGPSVLRPLTLSQKNVPWW